MLPESFRLAEVVCALSQALDLSTDSSPWHSVRTCILGIRIAAELKLPEVAQSRLYYALLLKDAPSAGQEHQELDKFSLPVERSCTLEASLGLPGDTLLDSSDRYRRWDGRGKRKPDRGIHASIAARVALVAQTLDVLHEHTGPEAALSLITHEQGAWFDPQVVKAAQALASRNLLWPCSQKADLPRMALDLEPLPRTVAGDATTLDAICLAFGSIVDAKSPFTFHHSQGVAKVAVAIASQMGLDKSRIVLLRHAALLHDLGKMALPNSILQKAGALNDREWLAVRAHPEHTYRILNSIRGCEEMSNIAASHHERLDGSGYFRGLTAENLPIEARILAMADVFEALSVRRPYRAAFPHERVLTMLRKATPHAYDVVCLEALEQSGATAVLEEPGDRGKFSQRISRQSSPPNGEPSPRAAVLAQSSG